MVFKVGDIIVARGTEFYKVIKMTSDGYLLIFNDNPDKDEFECSVHVTEMDTCLATELQVLLYTEW